MSSTDDRLSALPDSVLARVLSSLHLKAAVQTSVLSKRWRTLWREADGVNLDTRHYRDIDYDGAKLGREFFRDALAAVGTDGRCPVRRLSVRADSYFQNDFLQDIMRTSPGMDALLAAPAMRRLEELRMELTAEFCQTREEYELPAGLLPGTSLQVLDIGGCTLGSPGTNGAIFSCLKTLRMVGCVTSSETLQSMLDTAPNLSTLWLEYVSFPSFELAGLEWATAMSMRRRILLRCPNATVSVTLMHCHCSWTDGVDLDAPGVRTLRYTGFLEHFPFSSAAPSGLPANLQHMELCFCTSRCTCRLPSRMGVAEPRAIFWESIGRFSRLRFLQLELWVINDIAVQLEQEDRFLKVFPDLRFLKLKGSCQEDRHGAAVAIANLLQCCPSMQEFHLKCDLHCDPYAFPRRRLKVRQKNKGRAEKSIMSFIKRIKSGDDDGVEELAALKARSFHCLDHHLRKIRFEFELESLNCFEVKLTKFFVENAAVLEEMEVHDGDQIVYDHIHDKFAE
jgi:hypothetical protein